MFLFVFSLSLCQQRPAGRIGRRNAYEAPTLLIYTLTEHYIERRLVISSSTGVTLRRDTGARTGGPLHPP